MDERVVTRLPIGCLWIFIVLGCAALCAVFHPVFDASLPLWSHFERVKGLQSDAHTTLFVAVCVCRHTQTHVIPVAVVV